MASLKLTELLKTMSEAAKKSLADKWPGIRDLATSSLRSIAQNFIDIEKMRSGPTPQISNEQAKLLIDLQKNTLRSIILTEEGLGLLAAEAAINAALNSIRTVVNKAIGFALV